MTTPRTNRQSSPPTSRDTPDHTSYVTQIRTDGQGFLNDLQNQAETWRSYASDMYEEILSLVNGWDDPSALPLSPADEPDAISATKPDEPSEITPDKISDPKTLKSVLMEKTVPSFTEPDEAEESGNLTGKSTGVSSIDYDDFPDAPTFSETFPTLDFTGEPGASVIADPGNVPTLVDPTIPAAPAITLPNAPTLGSITIPGDPTIDLPVFTAVSPTFDKEDPSGFEYHEAVYQSNLFDSAVAKIIADVEASSSGIDPAVEQALFDRGISRLNQEHDKLQTEAEQYFAGKGFFYPPGALASRLTQQSQIRSNAVTDLNNDIMVQRSNLAQQNIQSILGAGVQLEGILRQFHGDVQNRSLESAKALAGTAVSLYNAHIERLKADAAVYETEAKVYEAKLQGEISKVEIFKAMVEKAKVSAEVQEMLVKIYLAQLEGVKTLVDVYKTEMESAKIFTDVQVAKITAFKAQVDAFIAKWQGEDIKWKAYGTKVQAQQVKASAFSERVKVFQAETDAWGTGVNALVNKSRLQIDENNSKISAYQAEIQRYQQEVAFEIGKVQQLVARGELQLKKSDIESRDKAARADTQVKSEMGKLERERTLADNNRTFESLRVQGLTEFEQNMMAGETEYTRADVQAKSEHLRGVVSTRVENARSALMAKVEEFKLHLEKIKSQATVLAQIAASALSGMNANMSYGYSGSVSGSIQAGANYSYGENRAASWSDGLSNSYAQSDSTSDSTSNVTNTNNTTTNNTSTSTSNSTSNVTSNNTSTSTSYNDSHSTSVNTNNNISKSTSTSTSHANSVSNAANVNNNFYHAG